MILACILAVCLDNPPAQDSGGTLADFRLLATRDVRHDLELTEAQAEQLTEALGLIQTRLSARLREAARVRSAGGQETLPTVVRDIENEAKVVLDRVLTVDQRARYAQIKLRDRGPWSFIDPRVQADLKLDDRQIRQVEEIGANFRAEMAKLFEAMKAGGDARPDSAAKKRQTAELDRFYDDATRSLVKLLTPEQQGKWDEMLGPPISPAPVVPKPGPRLTRGGGGVADPSPR